MLPAALTAWRVAVARARVSSDRVLARAATCDSAHAALRQRRVSAKKVVGLLVTTYIRR